MHSLNAPFFDDAAYIRSHTIVQITAYHDLFCV